MRSRMLVVTLTVALAAAAPGTSRAATGASEDPVDLLVKDKTHDVVREPRACDDDSDPSDCPGPAQGQDTPAADIVRFHAGYSGDLTLRTKVRGAAKRVGPHV